MEWEADGWGARLAQLMARPKVRTEADGVEGWENASGERLQLVDPAPKQLPGLHAHAAADAKQRQPSSSTAARQQQAQHSTAGTAALPHLHSDSMRSGREWLLPVLESRPANTIGSMPPSSSGRATWGEKECVTGWLVGCRRVRSGIQVQEGCLAVDTTIARLPVAFVAGSTTSRPTQQTI